MSHLDLQIVQAIQHDRLEQAERLRTVRRLRALQQQRPQPHTGRRRHSLWGRLAGWRTA